MLLHQTPLKIETNRYGYRRTAQVSIKLVELTTDLLGLKLKCSTLIEVQTLNRYKLGSGESIRKPLEYRAK